MADRFDEMALAVWLSQEPPLTKWSTALRELAAAEREAMAKWHDQQRFQYTQMAERADPSGDGRFARLAQEHKDCAERLRSLPLTTPRGTA